jgi:hypothetical protein
MLIYNHKQQKGDIMMKLNNVALSIALIALSSGACFASLPTTSSTTPSTSAAAGPSGAMTSVNIKALFAVATCTGDNATCPVSATLNAMGEPFNIDPATAKITDLGSLTAERKIALALPAKADQSQAFSVTPSEGDMKGQKVYFAFQRHAKGAPGTQFSGVEIIDIFRQNLDNPKGLWLRAGRFLSDQGFPATFDLTFKPSGNAVLTDPNTKKDLTLSLGVRELGKA